MQMLNCVYLPRCRHVCCKHVKEGVRLRKRIKEKIPEIPGWNCIHFLTKASCVPAQVSDVIIDLGGYSVSNLSVRSFGLTFDQDLSFNSYI